MNFLPKSCHFTTRGGTVADYNIRKGSALRLDDKDPRTYAKLCGNIDCFPAHRNPYALKTK